MKSSYLPQSFLMLVPAFWHPALQTLGLESENALACLQVDLDGQLRFAHEILIVTDRKSPKQKRKKIMKGNRVMKKKKRTIL